MYAVLTGKVSADRLDQLNEAQSINKAHALDAFQLFYEELISSKPQSNRIRRLRPTTTPAK